MDVIDFGKTIYLGDRGCISMVIDSKNDSIKLE